MSRAAYEWKKAAAGILFPRRLCAACDKVSLDDILCPDCRASQAKLRFCPDCATIIAPTETADYRCNNCRGQQPPFVRARAALAYEGTLRQRLLAFKYQQQTGWRRALGLLLADTARRCYDGIAFHSIIPVPLSPERLAERGYNQAQLLTHILSQELELPHHPEYLRRVKSTPPLWDMPPRQRQEAMRGAFAASGRLEGQTILLVDDIYTSGATSYAASRALLKAGAEEVYVLTVATGRDL